MPTIQRTLDPALFLAHARAVTDRANRTTFLIDISLSQHVDDIRVYGEPDARDYEISAMACRRLCEIPSLVWC